MNLVRNVTKMVRAVALDFRKRRRNNKENGSMYDSHQVEKLIARNLIVCS